MNIRCKPSYLLNLSRYASTKGNKPLGFIGLGSMGSKMVQNFQQEGKKLLVYDLNPTAGMLTA